MIFSFIERARRRFLWNELLAQFATASALLVAGVILLLVLGTQILDWRVVIALAIAGSGIALYRMFRRMPTPYKVAVLVDERAGLHDSLSTALFFSDAGRAKVSDSVREVQIAQTERLLPSIDLNTAVPFTFPRALYALGVLGLIASSLFALRYGVSRKLDLKAPMTEIVMDGLGLHPPDSKQADAHKKTGNPGERADVPDDFNPLLAHSDQKKQGDLEGAPESAIDTMGDPDSNGKDKKETSTKGGDTKAEGGEKSEGDEGGTPAAQGKSGADNPAGSRDGPQQGEQQNSAQQQSQGGSSSLLSKMKDAVQNLLSKAKQPNGAGGQKPGQDKGAQKGQAQAKGEKGAAGKGEKGGSQESADSQDGQQSGDSDSADDSQSKGGGKSADQQASSQPGSGIGKQDGSKDVKAAEQLAAMGKLSEVIGKRSQNVTGEMTIEKQSGPQQLHTQYSKKTAAHGESGGDVSRDEVPVALQSYVQQYFEQVRKAEHKPAATKQ